MKKHDIVKYSKPEDDREKRMRFVLLDDVQKAIDHAKKLTEKYLRMPPMTPHVDIKYITDGPFPPINSVQPSDIELVMSVTAEPVKHADDPKKTVWEWKVIDREHPGNDYGGCSDTEEHALTDAAIVILNFIKRENERAHQD